MVGLLAGWVCARMDGWTGGRADGQIARDRVDVCYLAHIPLYNTKLLTFWHWRLSDDRRWPIFYLKGCNRCALYLQWACVRDSHSRNIQNVDRVTHWQLLCTPVATDDLLLNVNKYTFIIWCILFLCTGTFGWLQNCWPSDLDRNPVTPCNQPLLVQLSYMTYIRKVTTWYFGSLKEANLNSNFRQCYMTSY